MNEHESTVMRRAFFVVLAALFIFGIFFIVNAVEGDKDALKDDHVWVGSANDQAVDTEIDDCDTTSNHKLQYDAATNDFLCDSTAPGSSITTQEDNADNQTVSQIDWSTGLDRAHAAGEDVITVDPSEFGADWIDAVTDLTAGIRSGLDTTIVTGTAGTSGNCVEWNADGDVVDAGAACGTGGAGDSIEIEDGDDAGTFTAIDTTARFDDSGDINFTFADGGAGGPDTVTATVRADSVALTTDTTGNYAAGDAEAGSALTGDSATAFFSSGEVEDARIVDALTVSGGTVASSTITLDTGANPTADGQIRWDSTTERIEVGDDGAATLEFHPGAHTTDTSADTVCAGTTTYLDGDGGCDDITDVYVNEATETIGSGSDITWTFDVGATDPVIDFDSTTGVRVSATEVRIGDAGSPAIASADGDLFIEDDLEINGEIHIDSGGSAEINFDAASNDDHQLSNEGLNIFRLEVEGGSANGNTFQIVNSGAGEFDLDITGDIILDSENGIVFEENSANGNNFVKIDAGDSYAGDYTFSLEVTGDCTGNTNGGALTINASNELVCSDDDGGAGGGGDNMTVNSSAVDTTGNFLDGDIDFTLVDGGAGGPDDITATVGCTGCVDSTDILDDTITFADISDSSAIDIDTTFTAADGVDLTLTPTHTSGDTNFLTIDVNQTDDAAATDDFDALRIELISESGDAGDTLEGLVISQEAGTANTVIDAAIRIENLENAASTMTDAIIVQGGTADNIVDGLDVSDAEITNAINIGANPIAFSTGSLSATDLEILDDGTIDISSETNLTCGTNCTLTGDEISVDDAFILNAGDTGTGDYDFGGAGSFEIPNGAANTVNADGEIAHDTTADQVIVGADADVIATVYTGGITIESPADADNILMGKWAAHGITVTDIHCIVDPADSGESVVIDLQERDATGDTPATLDATITCDNDGAEDDGALSNGTIDKNDWWSIDIGTVTGTVTQLSVSWVYTITRE